MFATLMGLGQSNVMCFNVWPQRFIEAPPVLLVFICNCSYPFCSA